MADSFPYVLARRDQGYPGRLIQRLQPTNDGQKFQSLPHGLRLNVLGIQAEGAVHGAEYKPPAALRGLIRYVGKQQVMR
jgi:hypothetical protein